MLWPSRNFISAQSIDGIMDEGLLCWGLLGQIWFFFFFLMLRIICNEDMIAT